MPSPADQDACELLDADHLAVKHLFVEYARLAMLPSAPGADARHAIASKICDELTVHAQIEEEIFYPALQRAVPDASDILEEARDEHRQAKDMIARLRGMEEADAAMDALVAELNWAIEHHVKEERDELFPKARSAQGLNLEEVARQLRQRQEALQAEMAA
ncbi:hemerythrin domain-containing protein [Ramlibacter henchirensis]|uniref:Hemerythrin domain-containing protein n=1 Tax=Ramlibacter henchirensis TaxID=204072 RepID=A0A4Z0C253_9BURK|nr:hemerythrin domain-containing protein [Ramlibacter henchirensis]TFZ05593.1 hemerythrin domain-containing protein [Ramlibacter henchirensis]